VSQDIDVKVLVEYFKNDLFPKDNFVYKKERWNVGGKIYDDYIKCCGGRIGLQTMTEVEKERHMEKIWLRALHNKVQKKALVQKRSAIYTVMQNKFAGKYSPIPDTLRKVKIPTKCVSPKDLCKLCVENRCVLVSMESVKRRLEDPMHLRPIVFSTCISIRPLPERRTGRIVSRKRVGGLATTLPRHLLCWYLSTTTRRDSMRKREYIKLIF
jgi:hypothetical protein